MLFDLIGRIRSSAARRAASAIAPPGSAVSMASTGAVKPIPLISAIIGVGLAISLIFVSTGLA